MIAPPDETLPRSAPPLPEYSGVRVLVVGATGFIGRRVVRALARRGAEVVLAARDIGRARLVAAECGAGGALVLESMLEDARAVRELVAESRASVTFNLAAYGVDPAERDEAAAWRVNAAAAGWLAAAAATHADPTWSGACIVHAGTAAEYGDATGDLGEQTTPRPTGVYGRTKLAGSRAVLEACARMGRGGVVARLFTVYGPGEHAGRLLPALLDAAGHDRPLALTSGEHSRDFTFVDDVADGLLRLARASRESALVNLATGGLEPVRTFVEIAARELGIAPARLQFGAIPTRANEMRHAPVSVARLRALAGWAPPTTIAEGVRRTAREAGLLPPASSGPPTVDAVGAR